MPLPHAFRGISENLTIPHKHLCQNRSPLLLLSSSSEVYGKYENCSYRFVVHILQHPILPSAYKYSIEFI